jgi:hypothetical protein
MISTFIVWLYCLVTDGDLFNLLVSALLSVLVLFALWLTRHCYHREMAREYHSGYSLGLLRGRRDERHDVARDSAIPRVEAQYPLIVETREDGTKVRLDR